MDKNVAEMRRSASYHSSFSPRSKSLMSKSRPVTSSDLSSQQSNKTGARSTLDDGSRGVNSAVEHGLLLRYQPAIINATKPKDLIGPFDIYHVPDLRENISKNYKHDVIRRKQNSDVSKQFYEDLQIHDYFTNKSNWLNKSKYTSTCSFYSAFEVYLPIIKKTKTNYVSSKFIEIQRNRRNKK